MTDTITTTPAREQQSIPLNTPWGPSQSSRQIAPGIIRHDTASHGGYYVSPERVTEMPKPLRDFNPWAGPNWYEEDCDWCIVALAFPQFFPPDYMPDALTTLKNYRPEIFEQMSAIRTSGRAV